MPGVANYEAIREHHIAHMIAPGSFLGSLQNNPFFEETCEVARKAKLNFIVNAIYNSKEEVKAIVSGHFEEAHRYGANLSLREFAVKVDQSADVSIASVFPYEEGPQIMKPLGPATMVTKKGGTVILTASVRGKKLPEILLQSFDTAFDLAKGDPKRLVLDYLRHDKLIIPDAPMDFSCALDITLLYLSRVKVVMVSKDIDKDQAGRLGFGHASSLEEAIQKVSKEVPRGDVNILPAGGLIIPLMKEEMRFE
jgi:nickel-dependent lactate racemase